MAEVREYGSWPSPVSAELLVSGAASLSGLAASGGALWWTELRPSEGGRTQVCRRPVGPDGVPTGQAVDLLPVDEAAPWSARTRVHEYGGGTLWVHGSAAFFTRWNDERVYRLDIAPDTTAPEATSVGEPVALTAVPPAGRRWCFADGRVTPDGCWVVAVREEHGRPGATEAVNELVAFPTRPPDGGPEGADPVVIATGADFYSSPRVSADGRHLTWLQWNHPDMPWDRTELWLADLVTVTHTVTDTPTGADTLVARDPHVVISGDAEAVFQPTWLADGRLLYSSDRDGWWKLWIPGPVRRQRPVAEAPGEIGQPHWVFGMTSFCVTTDGVLVGVWRHDGTDHLGIARLAADGEEAAAAPFDPVVIVPTPWTTIDSPVALVGGHVAMLVASPTSETEIVVVPAGALDGSAIGGSDVHVVRPARDLGIDAATFSTPEGITFPTAVLTPAATAGAASPEEWLGLAGDAGHDGEGSATASDDEQPIAHALYYAPRNPDFVGPPDQRPPLVVMIHGGPTAAARPMLQLATQYWTTRGFAVVDVNYRGSVGYGRAFRDQLNGQWGIADVADCIAAARFLVDRGDVDPDRLVIRGGSAGGFTTLAALCASDVFRAGASHYGVTDLGALARDTHKFESRYLDRLVGPWPEAEAIYLARSPITHVERLTTPLIVLQGGDDQIVPASQAEAIVAALRANEVPHAYLLFPGEQHGFRVAANVIRAIEAELSFYAQVFGFAPGDPIEPVEIVRS